MTMTMLHNATTYPTLMMRWRWKRRRKMKEDEAVARYGGAFVSLCPEAI